MPKEKYGTDHVAQIGTFGTMLARGSVRDVARAMGFPVRTWRQDIKADPDGLARLPYDYRAGAMESVPNWTTSTREMQKCIAS